MRVRHQFRFDVMRGSSYDLAMKIVCWILAFLPVGLLAQTGLPGQPYIYIEGEAQSSKTPDYVELRFDVIGSKPDRAKANDEAQAKVRQVLALLKDRKIEDKDIIAQDLTSEPIFQETNNYQRTNNKIIGYMVTRPMEVQVRDVTVFPNLVDDLIRLGGIEFAHIEGGLTKQKEYEADLWEKALANAREKAEKTLKAMGMKIDSVFAVSPVGFNNLDHKMFESSDDRVIVTGSNAPAGKERAQPSEYRLAPFTFGRSAHVIYLISPAK